MNKRQWKKCKINTYKCCICGRVIGFLPKSLWNTGFQNPFCVCTKCKPFVDFEYHPVVLINPPTIDYTQFRFTRSPRPLNPLTVLKYVP